MYRHLLGSSRDSLITLLYVTIVGSWLAESWGQLLRITSNFTLHSPFFQVLSACVTILFHFHLMQCNNGPKCVGISTSSFVSRKVVTFQPESAYFATFLFCLQPLTPTDAYFERIRVCCFYMKQFKKCIGL